MNKTVDCIVIGGGIVGLTTALLLARHDFSVALVESTLYSHDTSTLTSRVTAIHATSQHLFAHINVWPFLKTAATPFQEMTIWDHTQRGHLQFDCADIHETEMGWIIENRHLIKILHEQLIEYPNITLFCPNTPLTFSQNTHDVSVMLDNHQCINASLVIGADGSNSWVRKQMAVGASERSYYQKSITTVITSAEPHHNTAYQKFLTTGPVALLPLSNPHHTALIWSADDAVSDRLMQMSDAAFSTELTHTLDYKLGVLQTSTPRKQFPLRFFHQEEYATSACALVGDAAHTIHPLAGLGVNVGLMDAACLTQTLIEARQRHKPLWDKAVLRRYTRWRKSENADIMMAIHALKTVFELDDPLSNVIRSMGINGLNDSLMPKNFLMKIAMGRSQDHPNLLQ